VDVPWLVYISQLSTKFHAKLLCLKTEPPASISVFKTINLVSFKLLSPEFYIKIGSPDLNTDF